VGVGSGKLPSHSSPIVPRLGVGGCLNMAKDRIAMWNSVVPSEEEVVKAARDYLGGAGVVTSIPNKIMMNMGATPLPESISKSPVRVVETFVDATHVDVVTKNADFFTDAVADGFFRLLTQKFGAKSEQA
jgi:hypothetical protein